MSARHLQNNYERYLNRFRTSELLSSSGNLGISFPCLPKYRQMENCFASMTFCFPVEGSTSGVSLLSLPTSLQISRQGRRQTLTHLLRNTAGFWTVNKYLKMTCCLSNMVYGIEDFKFQPVIHAVNESGYDWAFHVGEREVRFISPS